MDLNTLLIVLVFPALFYIAKKCHEIEIRLGEKIAEHEVRLKAVERRCRVANGAESFSK